MKNFLTVFGISALLTLLPACAGKDQRLEEQVTVTADKAVALAQKKIPGQPIFAKLAQMDDHYVYHVKIRDQQGTDWWVVIDASSGTPVERQTRPRLKY